MVMHRTKSFIAFFCLIGLNCCTCYDVYAASHGKSKIIISNKHQELATFIVDVAKSEEEKQKGLMHVRTLPENHGMLFYYSQPKIVSMWMKNTYIPLDIIFIGPNQRISKIHKNAQPHDETNISSDIPISAVLEVNAGEASKHMISVGNHISLNKQ